MVALLDVSWVLDVSAVLDVDVVVVVTRKLQGGLTVKLGGIWVGLTRVEKIMVLNWGRPEMVEKLIYQFKLFHGLQKG